MTSAIRSFVGATVVAAALLLTPGVADAQFLFSNDVNVPDELVGFRFLDAGTPLLSAIPNFVFGVRRLQRGVRQYR